MYTSEGIACQALEECALGTLFENRITTWRSVVRPFPPVHNGRHASCPSAAARAAVASPRSHVVGQRAQPGVAVFPLPRTRLAGSGAGGGPAYAGLSPAPLREGRD